LQKTIILAEHKSFSSKFNEAAMGKNPVKSRIRTWDDVRPLKATLLPGDKPGTMFLLVNQTFRLGRKLKPGQAKPKQSTK
jgi:hypothetical protein